MHKNLTTGAKWECAFLEEGYANECNAMFNNTIIYIHLRYFEPVLASSKFSLCNFVGVTVTRNFFSHLHVRKSFGILHASEKMSFFHVFPQEWIAKPEKLKMASNPTTFGTIETLQTLAFLQV